VIAKGLRSSSAAKVLTLSSRGTSPCESRMPTGMMRLVHGESCAHKEHARRRMSVTQLAARAIKEFYCLLSTVLGRELTAIVI
jgi:hypothetical protein